MARANPKDEIFANQCPSRVMHFMPSMKSMPKLLLLRPAVSVRRRRLVCASLELDAQIEQDITE
jgi:hypothetical protein